MTDERGHDGDGRRPVSRRRFVATAGATGLTVALAGCPDDGGNGDTTDGTSETEGSTGGTTGTTRDGSGDGTVRWGFEPITAAERDAITGALHDRGLSDDIDVVFEPGDADSEQRRADYHRVLESDDAGPDLFLMAYDWVLEFARRDQLAELSAVVSDETVAALDEEYFAALTAPARTPDSGDLFGVPISADFGTMQYRVDLVESAGYDPVEDDWATEPMTWAEWSTVAADVYDHADVEYGFTTQWDIYEGTACCSFNEVMSSWGGAYFGGRDNLFGPVGDRPITVTAEPVVKSLNMMRKFVHDEDIVGLEDYAGGFAPAAILGWVEEGSHAPFADGDAVFHRGWGGSLATTGRNPDQATGPALGERLGSMPLPYAVTSGEAQAEGAGGSTAGVRGWYATANPDSANRDAVAQVLDVVTEPGFQADLLSILGWLPPRPDLYDSSGVREAEGVGQFADTLRVAGANAMPRPVTSVWNDQASVIAQGANRAVGQEVTSSKAMADLESNLDAIERSGE